MVDLQSVIAIDVLLFLAVIVAIYLTYTAAVRLSMRKAKSWVIMSLRLVTVGEIIAIIYCIVDIPWTAGRIYYPQLESLLVLEYLFIYGIVTTMMVFPAISLLLRVSVNKHESERQELLSEREDVLKQIQVTTGKYLRKQIGEPVFIKIITDLQARVVAIESKLEKMRIEGEQPKSLFQS